MTQLVRPHAGNVDAGYAAARKLKQQVAKHIEAGRDLLVDGRCNIGGQATRGIVEATVRFAVLVMTNVPAARERRRAIDTGQFEGSGIQYRSVWTRVSSTGFLVVATSRSTCQAWPTAG